MWNILRESTQVWSCRREIFAYQSKIECRKDEDDGDEKNLKFSLSSVAFRPTYLPT